MVISEVFIQHSLLFLLAKERLAKVNSSLVAALLWPKETVSRDI
jgi:hypothetical protein